VRNVDLKPIDMLPDDVKISRPLNVNYSRQNTVVRITIEWWMEWRRRPSFYKRGFLSPITSISEIATLFQLVSPRMTWGVYNTGQRWRKMWLWYSHQFQ